MLKEGKRSSKMEGLAEGGRSQSVCVHVYICFSDLCRLVPGLLWQGMVQGLFFDQCPQYP